MELLFVDVTQEDIDPAWNPLGCPIQRALKRMYGKRWIVSGAEATQWQWRTFGKEPERWRLPGTGRDLVWAFDHGERVLPVEFHLTR